MGRVAPLIIILQTAFMFMRNHPKSSLHRISPRLLHVIIHFGAIADKNVLLIKVCCPHGRTCMAVLLSFPSSVVGQTTRRSWKSIRVDRSITHQHQTAFGGPNPFCPLCPTQSITSGLKYYRKTICQRQPGQFEIVISIFFLCFCLCWTFISIITVLY